jgi:virginiamycin B lyase
MTRKALWLGLAALALGAGPPARAAVLPGLGELTGTVAVPKGMTIVPVYAYNAARHVGYAVFAVNGTYRAVDLFPGRYEITVRKDGLAMQPVTVEVAAGARVTADLAPQAVTAPPTYVGGNTYEGVTVAPYERIYPPGPGRKIVERTCMVCHGVNFLPNNLLDRDGWAAAVDYMTREPAFKNLGFEAGPSMMDPARLSGADRKLLLDYLAKNFGPESTPRAVKQEADPPLDPAALSKAMFVEYRFPNTKAMPKRWTQEPHFDKDGNVYVTDRGSPPAIVRVDPRTGESKDFLVPDPKSSPHGLTVDADGTVWWAGRNVFLAHLDPATGLTDQYPVTELGFHGHTPVFNSKGDLWFSMLPGNKIGHWERATDTVTYYEVPEPRARPYGFVIDHKDKVWFVEYHADHVTRFDPDTKTFTRFPIKSAPASLRRLGVDAKDTIWYGVYGTVGKKGKLGHLDPATGAVVERELPIDYSNPYDAWPDEDDNIWASCDNYFVKFDQKTERFTVYPVPERTDQPKMMITREGAIWFTPRDAGHAGYGGAASVLYPDMDKITTLAAYYSENSSANHVAKFHGPAVKVTGAVKLSKDGAQNPEIARVKIVGRKPGAPAGKGNDGKLAD